PPDTAAEGATARGQAASRRAGCVQEDAPPVVSRGAGAGAGARRGASRQRRLAAAILRWRLGALDDGEMEHAYRRSPLTHRVGRRGEQG
ncbi:MAG TPA: hypothetical protein VL242_54845, partial [Sorangium sp.]|nr:hypothetical protein [Sorangium sp.]